jgi:ATP-dependent exoDNAse (exonuclease V) beta subunit
LYHLRRAAAAAGATQADGGDGGLLLFGYIDPFAVADGRIEVIDFKTDALPQGPVEHAYPQYVGQVRAYGRLLGASGILQDCSIRCGLLFTVDRTIWWGNS